MQALILLTGNYTFFNWLAILLCLPLLDDDALTFRRHGAAATVPFALRCPRWSRFVVLPVSMVLALVTLMSFMATLRIPERWPAAMNALRLWVEPFRSANNYGLFAVMTQKRPEIIIEGSDDGKIWKPYEFKYKVGDLKKRPQFVAPFQPRLDWQMWFAALSRPQDNPWLFNFMVRILQNSRRSWL